MGLLAVLALGVVFWAIATGKVRRAASRETAALAMGVAGMAVLGSGKLVAGVALMVASAALWPWRKRPAASGGVNTGGVNVDEARALLGVPADADAETIRAAHRRLIAQTHPDRGGTEELARRINLARDAALSAISTKDEPESV